MSSTFPVLVATPGSVLAGLRDELGDVVERLAAEAAAGTFVGLPAAVLSDLTRSLISCADRVSAVAVHATGQVHVTGAAVGAGHLSTKAWLSNVVGLPERDAGVAVARAASLHSELPATWAAWNTGQITGPAAREISIAITSAYRGIPAVDRATQVPISEAILLQVARTGSFPDLRAAAGALRDAVTPDGSSAAAMAAFDDQSLTLAGLGSMTHLTGYLTPQTHALLVTALEQIIDGWYRTGSLTGTDQPTGARVTDRRTQRLRRPHLLALALGELARRQVENCLLGSRHLTKPHLTVLVDAARHATGAPSALRIPGQTHPSTLPAESVRRLLCDADLTLVAITPDPTTPAQQLPPGAGPNPLRTALTGAHPLTGTQLTHWLRAKSRTVLFIGRETRTIPRPLRTALEIRDGGCSIPDCSIDTTRCEAHHVQHREHGGRTDITNLALLCPRHHHLVHEGAWTLTPNPSKDPGHPGYWTLTRPG